MADENKSKAAAWTDREKVITTQDVDSIRKHNTNIHQLAYIFGLIEASGIKLNSQVSTFQLPYF
jgi:hypothetical protein